MRESKQTVIKALGEVALRVNDLDLMQQFYQEVVGLELMNRSSGVAFFKIAEGYGGHTQVLALFDRAGAPGNSRIFRATPNGVRSDTSTLDHIAFEIDLADLEQEKARLKMIGQRVEVAEHAWVHWRSIYVNDPEGNTVEWVCFDEHISESGNSTRS